MLQGLQDRQGLRQQLHQPVEDLPRAAGVRVQRSMIPRMAYLFGAMAGLVPTSPASAASYVCEAKAEYKADDGFLERQSDF
jgi:hypothetical protein